MKPKFRILILLITGIATMANAQETNIFYMDPPDMKGHLKKQYREIHLQIMTPSYSGREMRMAGTRSIQFFGDTLCQIIDQTEKGDADTSVFRYNACGHLLFKKGRSSQGTYSYHSKGCQVLNRESHEVESENFAREYIRYQYDKGGRLLKEMIYSMEDTSVVIRYNTYGYTKGNLDSMAEYLIYNEETFKNRSTRYFGSQRSDSVHYYNFEHALIDRTVYEYNPDGTLRSIVVKSLGSCVYEGPPGKDPEKVIVNNGRKEMTVTYIE